ncbi:MULTISPECIES: ABC transporter substrate-binding protein [unclassified Variovorax]|uniref:ABC transporter substrate-binding protein n=1 Tax=unclassified Variovorax TaxID=663243 RepID=UPI00257649BC|nr:MULTISPECIES: ABC transporter substrate-binding protein [unclassified Variovorax]MDM0087215.1 ABC transporter substrate-binding protein [Variovorax sp. J22G40]MDM0144528.1 ABC transporter substrate-binding protein [Variovorax sp. J2P1-31]
MSTSSSRTRTSLAFVGIVLVAVTAFLAFGRGAFDRGAANPIAPAKLALDAPLPTEVPPRTRLVIGDPTTQRVLQHKGWDKNLPFDIEWANISGGPGVTEAFQARALDVGSAANIPPIHAVWVGIPVKIIAWRHKSDPFTYPTYVIGLSPKSKIASLADLKGKKLAFSPGQAQGAVVLRTLAEAGLTPKDVTLVDLPSTSDVYTGALASGLVDAAPLGRATLGTKRYLDAYGKEGARILGHGRFRDDAGNLYVRDETLADPAKAAALRAYVQLWARATEWAEQNRAEWTRIYYIEDQGVSAADAQYILTHTGPTEVPADWNNVIALQQETVDFMARQIGRESFDAATLFDRRFEKIAFDTIHASRNAVAAADAVPLQENPKAPTP